MQKPHYTPPMALPTDVIFSEILPKLPFKSLMRFKCVCKTFKTTISSFEFINNYLHPCLSSNVDRFLFLPTKNDLLYSYNCDSLESPTITIINLPSTFNGLSGYVSIIGSCNGLLCISKGYESTRHFILLNPSTGKFWEIPFVRFRVSQLILNFGFGYDAAKGDYKIVSFFDYVCENGAEMRGVVVYSLKAGSWRWVGGSRRTTLDCIKWSNNVVLLGHNLLHCVFSLSSRRSRIGCFDIGSETWRDDVMMTMMYYYDEHGYEAIWLNIGVLDGCLCSTFENRHDSNFDVWIMKEYGVYDLWVRLFSISISSVPGKIIPIACRKGSKDEVLLRVRNPTKLLWYNGSCDEMVEVELNEVHDLSNLPAWICVRSPGDDQFGSAI